MNISGVGEMGVGGTGVGEMWQIIGETGVGETGTSHKASGNIQMTMHTAFTDNTVETYKEIMVNRTNMVIVATLSVISCKSWHDGRV